MHGPLLRVLPVVLLVGALVGPSLLTESLVVAVRPQRRLRQIQPIHSLILHPQRELAAHDVLPTYPTLMTSRRRHSLQS